jgi:hypothetical protein
MKIVYVRIAMSRFARVVITSRFAASGIANIEAVVIVALADAVKIYVTMVFAVNIWRIYGSATNALIRFAQNV